MDYMNILQAVLASMVSGGTIGIVAFLSKLQKGEAFELTKMAKTGAIGAVIGAAMYATGNTITEENYVAYCAANGGVVMLIDKLCALAINYYKKKTA